MCKSTKTFRTLFYHKSVQLHSQSKHDLLTYNTGKDNWRKDASYIDLKLHSLSKNDILTYNTDKDNWRKDASYIDLKYGIIVLSAKFLQTSEPTFCL